MSSHVDASAPEAAEGDDDPGITIGVTGLPPRWSVSAWGALTAWGADAAPALDWFVAADDRWHVPANEPTVRQSRIEGSPVVETRLRVPDGDAVQRVWAVPERGGMVVVEFENESPMPFAVAVTGAGLVTERPPADVPVQGIELPDDAIVLPVGHRASVRVVVPGPDGLSGESLASLPALPPMLAVARGWTRVAEQASRVVLPDEALAEALVAARCDLLLEGPVDADEDPVGFLLDVAELVRCGDAADAWLMDVVEPAERVARLSSGESARWFRRGRGERPSDAPNVAETVDALAGARFVAARAGDDRAAADIDRMIERVANKSNDEASADAIRSLADLRRDASVGRFVRSVERRLASDGVLLPGGIPTGWVGSNFEVHGVPIGGVGSSATTVSFALRWHGERPAVLWEQHGGTPLTLTAPDSAPDWSTDEAAGETLWPAPRLGAEGAKIRRLDVAVDPSPPASSISDAARGGAAADSPSGSANGGGSPGDVSFN